MSKASQDTLFDLHASLARAMQEKLDDGTATAADLSAIAKFLKDNNISVDAQNANSPLAGLLASLPFNTQEARN